MRIFDIELPFDGGSVEFKIRRDGKTIRVWLDTPWHGEPRALRINSQPVSIGDADARQLVSDIDEWEQTLPPGTTEEELIEALEQTFPPGTTLDERREALLNYRSLSKFQRKILHEIQRKIFQDMEESAVKHVRDYVAKHYAV